MNSLKTSASSYITMLIIYSLFGIILPFVMGYTKYISSGFWIIHLISVVVIIWLFIYVYQEIIFTESSITQKKFSLAGWKNKVISYSDLISWESGQPCKLYAKKGVTMLIPWFTFSKADRKLLFLKLSSLNLPEK